MSTVSESTLPALVVFDIAGTTVEDGAYVVSRCLCDALSAAGFDVPLTEANAVMGIPKDIAIGMLLSSRAPSDADREEAILSIHADFLKRMNRYYVESTDVRAIPGTEETFRALRAAGILVTLDTGFGRVTTDIILRRLNWCEDGQPLDGVITSDEAPQGRPHPDMIQSLMNRFGITAPARVAKVGDTPSDLQQGTSAGCGWVIGVTAGTHTREQLQPYPHTHLIHSVADVPAVFGLSDA
jgi:phosphonatase-like hydrolase